MNIDPAAILALISELYTVNSAQKQRIAQLEAEASTEEYDSEHHDTHDTATERRADTQHR